MAGWILNEAGNDLGGVDNLIYDDAVYRYYEKTINGPRYGASGKHAADWQAIGACPQESNGSTGDIVAGIWTCSRA